MGGQMLRIGSKDPQHTLFGGVGIMDEVSKKWVLRKDAPRVMAAPLLEALSRAELPATQKALSTIRAQKFPLNAPQTPPPHADPGADARALLESLASAIRAWRERLPEELQPALLAIVHGGAPIEVDALELNGLAAIALTGYCQGHKRQILVPAQHVQFLCVPRNAEAAQQGAAAIGFRIDGRSFQA
jgi:hypothetical protein